MAFAGLSAAVPADDGIGLDAGRWTPAPRGYTPLPAISLGAGLVLAVRQEGARNRARCFAPYLTPQAVHEE